MYRTLFILTIVFAIAGGTVMSQNSTATPVLQDSESATLVQRFIEALEDRNADLVAQFLHEDVTLVQPMTFSGRPEPEFVMEGQTEVLGYLQTVLVNFAQIRFVEPLYTTSDDGSRVFVETRGDLRTAQGDLPYNNVYIFRFDIEDGHIIFINEYANPVPASAVLGIPLGLSEGGS